MNTKLRPSSRLRLLLLAVVGWAALLGASPGTARALCMSPMYRNPFFFQAHQALRDGRYLEAIDLYRKAARTPEQARRWISAVWYQLGQQSRMAGRHLEAADHFRAALREMPAHQGAAINLVHSFADGGKSHQALSALRRLPRGLRDVRRLLHLEARGWLGPAERAALRRLGADRPTLTGPGMLGNL